MKQQRRLSDFVFFLAFGGTLGLLFLLADGPSAAAWAVLGSALGIGAMSLWRRSREARSDQTS